MRRISKRERLRFAAVLSWIVATNLAFVFAFVAVGWSLSNLLLPLVIPVALIWSTATAIVFTPFTFWAMRNSLRNFVRYGAVLYALLVAWILFIIPTKGTGAWAFYGLFVVALIGLILIGFTSDSESDSRSV